MAKAHAKEEKGEDCQRNPLNVPSGLVWEEGSGGHNTNEKRRDGDKKAIPIVCYREGDCQDPKDNKSTNGPLSEHAGSPGELPIAEQAHESDGQDGPTSTQQDGADDHWNEDQPGSITCPELTLALKIRFGFESEKPEAEWHSNQECR